MFWLDQFFLVLYSAAQFKDILTFSIEGYHGVSIVYLKQHWLGMAWAVPKSYRTCTQNRKGGNVSKIS